MGRLKGPLRRFGFAFRPGFGPDDAGAIRRHIDPRLQVVPDVRRPVERGAEAEQLVGGVDLDFFLIAFEHDFVALVDEAHIRHLALVPFAHHIGFDGVVLQVRVAHEHRGALEEPVVDGLYQALVALLFAHVEFEARADPGQRRIGKRRGRLDVVGGRFAQLERFKILFNRQIRQNAPANVAL